MAATSISEALRDPKIEFILTEHPWMEDDTLYSDIILPTTTTKFEEYDISSNMMGGDVWLVDNCIDRIGEAKTDYEVSLEIAKKAGSRGKNIPGASRSRTG
jgi:anaerobic selenocysteine-containing dehydrogenase